MERHESLLCRSLEINPEICYGCEVVSGIVVELVSVLVVVVSGASAPFAAPVPPSVIAVSPVGDDETFTGVSVVESEEGPHAKTVTPTIAANSSFFIIIFFVCSLLFKKLYHKLRLKMSKLYFAIEKIKPLLRYDLHQTNRRKRS